MQRVSEQGILLRGITKRFGSHEAVSDVDLEVYRGEFFTMLGTPRVRERRRYCDSSRASRFPTQGRSPYRGVDVTGNPALTSAAWNTVFQELRPLFRTSMSPGTWPTVYGFDA